MSSMLAKALPDKVIELINLLLVVVRQRVLLSVLAFDESSFNLKEECSMAQKRATSHNM